MRIADGGAVEPPGSPRYPARMRRRTTDRPWAAPAIVAALTAPYGLGWHYLLAQALATGVVLVVGFALNRWWTFSPHSNVGSSD